MQLGMRSQSYSCIEKMTKEDVVRKRAYSKLTIFIGQWKCKDGVVFVIGATCGREISQMSMHPNV